VSTLSTDISNRDEKKLNNEMIKVNEKCQLREEKTTIKNGLNKK
jgi:hypothetical protein